MINGINTDFETRRSKAIGLWNQQKELENDLYKQYLANMNLYPYEYSIEQFLNYKKEHAKTHPANSSLSNAMGAWDRVYAETLYSKNPQRAKSTLANRQAGIWMTDILMIMALLSRLIGPTVGAVLFASISGIGLLAGSIIYLGKATYDYFNTPKSERTPLQKFNMLSSIPSTLLAFLFVNIAISAVAAPGLLLPMILVAGAWFGYKVWQANKGASIKWAEYRQTEAKLSPIENELAELRRNDPMINAAVEKETIAARVQQIEQDPHYLIQQREKEDLQRKLAELDGASINRREEAPSFGGLSSYSMFNQNRGAEYSTPSYTPAPPRKQ